MAKDPKNTNIFSTLGASNHSENERQKRRLLCYRSQIYKSST